MSLSQSQLEGLGTPAYDTFSQTGSIRSKAPSGLDKDLISKFDEKRKAKYQLLRDLQLHDQGKNYYKGIERFLTEDLFYR